MGAGLTMPISAAVSSRQRMSLPRLADVAMKAAARFWFGVTVVGQLFFAVSVAMFYGLTAARGDMHAWNKSLTHGIIPGDAIGNTALRVHLLSAVVIILSGAVQLMPQIRNRAPRFHRWNGRIYMATAFSISLAGLYLMWVRGTVGGLGAHLAQSLDAVLIMLFALLAVRAAIARDFRTHRRWALRLYLVVSASLFLRAALPLLGLGFDSNTFLAVLSFAQYAVPLGMLELYLHAEDRGGVRSRLAVAIGLSVLTLALAGGIFAATAGMFLPKMKKAMDTRQSIAETLAATLASNGMGDGIEGAARQYHDLKTAYPAVYNFEEDELNGLGYQLIAAKQFKEAIGIFQLNVEAYPKSANTYDSLAEGYMDDGDKARAIAYYEKSLRLNPKNGNAVRMLQKLNAP
jgi:tetratricopeptide (TPR) repeat protein